MAIEPEPCAGRHHRRAARAHGGDDLLGVDSLRVDRRGAEVGVAELALNDVERHALTRELERTRVAQLMRRDPAPDACLGREAPELAANGGARPRSPAGRAVDDAEQRADRQLCPCPATAVAVPSPTRPCRPRGGARPSRCVSAAIRAGNRGRARRARALPGCAAQRATRRRSSLACASRDGYRERDA